MNMFKYIDNVMGGGLHHGINVLLGLKFTVGVILTVAVFI